MTLLERILARRVGVVLLVLTALGCCAVPGYAGLPAAVRTMVARQAALDRAGFSPGVLDGRAGRKTVLALKAFQAARGLPVTGTFDHATLAALGVANVPSTVTRTITAGDLRAVGPVPRDWNAKAKLNRLRYESLAALLAERGHCTRALLARLNPDRNLAHLRPGDRVVLPNVWPHKLPPAASLTVDLDAKTICAKNRAGRTIALFHCSIAKFAEKRPRGTAHVTGVAFDPAYTFNPKMWPEVHGVTHTLRIPPGPRNPVGVCWIDLSLPGYGIHGTPTPELIGKTGSHGCIRLANWDARRLGHMVRPGTPVQFVPR
jgi:lipoprotein-anchoring transpeptidase ErfK/SrfK